MKLKDIVKELDLISVKGNLDIEIKNINYDSRKIQNQGLFICVKGFKVDGHNYIDKAVKNGAVAIIAQDHIERDDILVIRVNDSRKAMAYIASSFYGNPTKAMDIIGITGTNGKTTITYLMNSILDGKKKNSGIIGTICHKILDKEYKANNTTPEAFELQKMFREMKDVDVNVAIMEVSSHSIELNRVDGIEFNIGIFTNLTKDHLDYHENMESYYEAKKKLFYMTKEANIVNTDDEYGNRLVEELKEFNVRTITYAIDKDADIKAENISLNTDGVTFQLITPKDKGYISINTPGKFSVYNSLAAAGAAYALGYSFSDIKKGLENNKGVPGRFERVENSKGYNVIVDYSHTPDSLKNAIITAREFTNRNIITVFGCGGDRDKTKRRVMAKIASELSDKVIITSDNPRSENPNEILDDIEKGIIHDFSEYKKIVDRKEAIKEAINMASNKDIVLIAGKGHETYQIIGDRIIDFDDREIARAIIEEDL